MKCPTCGKVAHETQEAAERHAHSLGKAGVSFVDLNVYRCGPYWHVGHNPIKFAKRVRRALAAGRTRQSVYRRRAK